MSEPTLVVDRLSVTLRYTGAQPPPPERLAAPLRRATEDGGLAEALRGLRLPPGRWCVPRLELTVPLDLDRPEPALARDWAEAVAAAVGRMLREGSARGDRAGLVHYPDDMALVADAVAGIATGRLARLWAWRQTGLLRSEDPGPGTAPGPAVLALLGRRPHLAPGAVLRVARTCGLAPLDRALGRVGWAELAALVAVPAWTDPAVYAAPAGRTAPEPGQAPDRVPALDSGQVPVLDPDLAPAPERVIPSAVPATWELARALLAGSVLIELVRQSRLRSTAPVRAAWAVLVAAETDPAAVRRPPRAGLPALLADGLRAAAAGELLRPPAPASVSVPHPSPPPDATPVRRPPQPPSRPTPAAEPFAPQQEAERPATPWAGLLFLFATAPEAGLPDRALDEPALAARPLPWTLYAAGRALVPPVAPDDPALLALAGLDRDRAALVLAAPPPTEPESAAIAALATSWAHATASRLHGESPCEPFEVVAALARRPGRIAAAPGWIEAHLDLSDTDPDIRRAGLDLDPGWLPWLGAVVRYVYA
ncbi:hypothetical protein [Streptomyces sp. AP-93]|uniref:hypothetical protein n=1 Tax=Streptomyces sp. AP-93 TaxID=2929048 RepID=UPI001FAEB939|nr:hypothetical protein [Streptomyces sp. AP-93]MCJ0874248.1 hypothetical protein [Streptomyces sp. AP-93]